MVYSNSRYEKPISIAPIYPIREIPKIQKIQDTQAIQPISKIYGPNSIAKQKQMYNQTKKSVDTFLSNYNDPTELNSYVDALVNREAVSKKFGETWGTISTISGVVSIIAAVVEIGAWIASAVLPDFGAIGAAGTGVAKGVKYGTKAAAVGAKAAAKSAKAAAATIAAKSAAKAAQAARAVKIASAAQKAATVGKVARQVSRIAAIPAIPAATYVTYTKTIRPIIKGRPKEAVLNTLMNLGETVDTLANPIKGFVHEGPEGFIKGLGIADGGRINYDYDTGFFLTDMLLEIISDPTNWVTMGTKSALKVPAKIVGKQGTEEFVQESVGVVNKYFAKSIGQIDAAGSTRISKKVSKTAADVAKEWSYKSFADLTETAREKMLVKGRRRIQQTLVKAIKAELPGANANQITTILRRSGRSARTGRFMRSIANQISDLGPDTLTSDVLKGLSRVSFVTDQYEKSLIKGALMGNQFGLGIDAAKKGASYIKDWANVKVLNNLKKPKYFNPTTGIDLKHWEAAKNTWLAGHDKMVMLTGEVVERNKDTFYNCANIQLNRDIQLIRQIQQLYKNDPIKISAALDARFNELYGYGFQDYIAYLKGINDLEQKQFTDFLKYAENINAILERDAVFKASGEPLKTGAQLWGVQNLGALQKDQTQIIQKIQQKIQHAKTPIDKINKAYTLKYNDYLVNAALLNDPQVNEIFNIINSGDGVGAFLENVLSDLNAYKPDKAAQILGTVKVIKDAGVAYTNMQDFYNNVAKAVLPEIKGISDLDFKRYVIDQIFGMQKTSVSQLLAEFEDTTLPNLVHSLEVFLFDKGFKMDNYPGLREQIGQLYRAFLEAQQSANLSNVSTTILKDFSESVNLLIKLFPDYAKEFEQLNFASSRIKTILSVIKAQNDALIDAIFTEKNIITDTANTRVLSDVGLALNTVSVIEDVRMFKFPEDVSGALVKRANKLGHTINDLVESLQQYNVFFDDDMSTLIQKAYNKVKTDFFESNLELPNEAFKYFNDEQIDVYTMFARLVEFHKSIAGDKLLQRQFYQSDISTELLRKIVNPNALLKTDFAEDAMAQSARIAKKTLNEETINSINAYDNLGITSKKITNDFIALRQVLGDNKLDRPKRKMYERYIKSVDKYNKVLENVRKQYQAMFDKELAQTHLEELRNVMLYFPDLAQRYDNLVDTLEDYWNGTKTFQQSFKTEAQRYNKLRKEIEYQRAKGLGFADVSALESELKQLEEQGIIDEFTPFWEQISEMNESIVETLSKNSDIVKENDIVFTPRTPWAPVKKQQEFQKLIRQATNKNAKNVLSRIISYTPEQFIQELAFKKGVLSFKDSDVSDELISKRFDKFLASIENIPEIVYEHDQKHNRYWFVLRHDQKINVSQGRYYLNGNPISRINAPRTFDEFKIVDDFLTEMPGTDFTDSLNNLPQTLQDLLGTSIGDSQGDFLGKTSFEKIFETDLNNKPKFVPQRIWNELPKDKKTGQVSFPKELFESYQFNESFLGTIGSHSDLGLQTGDMFISLNNTLTQAQNYLKPNAEYVASVFNSVFDISNPEGVFAKYTDAELLKALQINPEYKLVTLVDHKKYGVKVREILPTSLKAIEQAKRLGAVVIPLQTYKDMYNKVNKRLGTAGAAKLWNRYLFLQKQGVLLTRLGTPLRNWLDTNSKTAYELGTSDYKSYKDLAVRIVKERDHIHHLLKRKNPEGLIEDVFIKQYFENNPKSILNWELYRELEEDYFSQGVSGNATRQLREEFGKDLWRSYTDGVGKISDFLNKTEDYNRLAVYLHALDMGEDTTGALARLSKVHFDYSFKTVPEQLAEMIFPFITFTLRNFSYWVEEVEKYPWLLQNYIHLMKPSWDFKDVTPEELAKNHALQNSILNGHLKLNVTKDAIISLKANPSIQDAINFAASPLSSVYDRLAPPLSTPIKLMQGEDIDLTNLVPIAGPITQSIQTIAKTGSPVPSVLGIQKRWKTFKNKNYSKINTYRDKQYRVPRYRNNMIYDSYTVNGVSRYRLNLYPVLDVAHTVRSRYSVDVYNRVKSRVEKDVFKGIRYRLKLDVNRFR